MQDTSPCHFSGKCSVMIGLVHHINLHIQTKSIDSQVDSPLFAATVAAAAPLQLYQEDPVHQPLAWTAYEPISNKTGPIEVYFSLKGMRGLFTFTDGKIRNYLKERVSEKWGYLDPMNPFLVTGTCDYSIWSSRRWQRFYCTVHKVLLFDVLLPFHCSFLWQSPLQGISFGTAQRTQETAIKTYMWCNNNGDSIYD